MISYDYSCTDPYRFASATHHVWHTFSFDKKPPFHPKHIVLVLLRDRCSLLVLLTTKTLTESTTFKTVPIHMFVTTPFTLRTLPGFYIVKIKKSMRQGQTNKLEWMEEVVNSHLWTYAPCLVVTYGNVWLTALFVH